MSLKTNSGENLADGPLTFLSVSTEEYSALGNRKAIVATRICREDKFPIRQTICTALGAPRQESGMALPPLAQPGGQPWRKVTQARSHLGDLHSLKTRERVMATIVSPLCWRGDRGPEEGVVLSVVTPFPASASTLLVMKAMNTSKGNYEHAPIYFSYNTPQVS